MTQIQEEQAPSGVRQFPQGFRWGVATAAYQIEGSTAADGRTPSIWDTFAATPGKVDGGDTGEVACDHYRRSAADVALMRDLGVGTYRFSVSWPRVLPDDGPVNARGLDFYDRLVDELVAAGIQPMVTLYHWDLPQYLEDRGGWTSREAAERFADLAVAVHDRLGDRVPTWTTLNEPWCSAFLGYASGDMAPGRRDQGAAFTAVHHLLVAHGLGAAALRAAGAAELSYTTIITRVTTPDPDDAADAAAVRLVDGLHNRLFIDPVLTGSYAPDMAELVDRFAAPGTVRDGDGGIIGGTPIDLLGLNYYQPTVVRARRGDGVPNPQFPGAESVEFLRPDLPRTVMDWPVDATGLRDSLVRVSRDWPGVPLMITENGAAYEDRLVDGRVADVERIAYIRGHLEAAHEAIQAGADLRGYLAWSLLDNFEWAYGYDKRFGLVRVDYETQERLPKDSAAWYRSVMASNAV
jgi:beta-glucosidase